jgi:hypothetical protein
MKSTLEPKFQFAVLVESPNLMGGLRDTDSIEWFYCKQTGDYLFDFYQGNALVSSINLEKARFDLQNLVGIIVVGSPDAFEAIRNNWRSRLPAAGLAFKQISEVSGEAVRSAALECMAEALTTHRNHAGRAALELATYRREFERLQHNFARVEEYVGRQSFQRPTEVFEYPPDLVTATEGDGRARLDNVAAGGSLSLSQYLPVDSLGLSSFSIYISAKPDAAAEPLQVKIKAIETGHIFGAWSIFPGKVREGWVELALENAIDEPALSLFLIVEWPLLNSGWALSLGPPHPYKEFCACDEAGEHRGAPIALRIFSSLPGVRVAATTTAIRPTDASHVTTEFIPYEVYESVIQVAPPLQDNKPPLVSYGQDIGCITVHPGGSGPTVGRINIAVPKQAWGISAQIHLAHERASPTQFGLMVCASRDESKELARLEHLDRPSRTFSGWKTLSALERKSITLLLPNAPEERLSIYLMTRQAPDISPDFAWARFTKLEFNVLPKSTVVDKEGGEWASVTGEEVPASRGPEKIPGQE